MKRSCRDSCTPAPDCRVPSDPLPYLCWAHYRGLGLRSGLQNYGGLGYRQCHLGSWKNTRAYVLLGMCPAVAVQNGCRVCVACQHQTKTCHIGIYQKCTFPLTYQLVKARVQLVKARVSKVGYFVCLPCFACPCVHPERQIKKERVISRCRTMSSEAEKPWCN